MAAEFMIRLVAIVVLVGIACLVVTPFAVMVPSPLRAWRQSRRALQTMSTRARSLLSHFSLPLLPAEPVVVRGNACMDVNALLCTLQC